MSVITPQQMIEHMVEALNNAVKDYPEPQRKPLPEMAVFDLADQHMYEGGKNYGILAFARAIEAAHGIKP